MVPGTRGRGSGSMRMRSSWGADGVDNILFTQDRGVGHVVHSRGGGNSALEDLVGVDGQGECVQGLVMHKMSSNVKNAPQRKKQGLWLSGCKLHILDIRIEG